MAVNPSHPYQQTPEGVYYRPALQADTPSEIAARPGAWTPGHGMTTSTLAGTHISPTRALALPAYYAAQRAIAEDVAKLPLLTYERLPRGKRRAENHWAFQLLHNMPNPDMSAMTFRETLTSWVLGWGNAYAEIERNPRGEALALWPIHPGRIPPQNIARSDDGDLIYDVRIEPILKRRRRRDRFDTVRIRAENILHIKGLGDGYYGMSVAQVAAENLGLNLAAQTFASAFYGNGLNPGSVFEHPQTLSDKAVAHLRDSLRERHGGPQRSNAPLILEEGMQYKRQAIPPNEAQFIETRQFGIEDIARLFRIPPHKIQHLMRATFNNIESQSLEYVNDTLMPWLVRWEQELFCKLFLDTDFFAEHLVTGLLRGDMAARADYMWKRFQMGSLSPDDIREVENENPIGTPAGEAYYIQANMASLDSVAREDIDENSQRRGRRRMAPEAMMAEQLALAFTAQRHTNGAHHDDDDL